MTNDKDGWVSYLRNMHNNCFDNVKGVMDLVFSDGGNCANFVPTNAMPVCADVPLILKMFAAGIVCCPVSITANGIDSINENILKPLGVYSTVDQHLEL